jgi:hypothetical protein
VLKRRLFRYLSDWIVPQKTPRRNLGSITTPSRLIGSYIYVYIVTKARLGRCSTEIFRGTRSSLVIEVIILLVEK